MRERCAAWIACLALAMPSRFGEHASIERSQIVDNRRGAELPDDRPPAEARRKGRAVAESNPPAGAGNDNFAGIWHEHRGARTEELKRRKLDGLRDGRLN